VNHQTALRALSQASGWRKSSYSKAQNDCVEITAEVTGWVGVRDSTLGAASPLVAVPRSEWRAVLAASRAGKLHP
jgi:hypothetical protein